MDLQTGDVFCVQGNMGAVSSMIRLAERIWSRDNQAVHGHAGIIRNSIGETLEALWTVKESHLDEYRGKQVIIYRPVQDLDGAFIDPAYLAKAYGDLLEEHLGRWYPVHRLALHLVPPLAKYISTGRWLVCSELVAKYLWLIDARDLPYTGVNPDTLADEWRYYFNFQEVFSGIWEGI